MAMESKEPPTINHVGIVQAFGDSTHFAVNKS